jgi:hypothetical protein
LIEDLDSIYFRSNGQRLELACYGFASEGFTYADVLAAAHRFGGGWRSNVAERLAEAIQGSPARESIESVSPRWRDNF